MGPLWQNTIPRGDVEFEVPPPVPIDPNDPNKQPALPEEPPPPEDYDPARLVRRHWFQSQVARPEEVVRVLLDVYLPGGISPQATARLVEFVKRGNPARGPALDRRVRETVHAIVAMPEYQLA